MWVYLCFVSCVEWREQVSTICTKIVRGCRVLWEKHTRFYALHCMVKKIYAVAHPSTRKHTYQCIAQYTHTRMHGAYAFFFFFFFRSRHTYTYYYWMFALVFGSPKVVLVVMVVDFVGLCEHVHVRNIAKARLCNGVRRVFPVSFPCNFLSAEKFENSCVKRRQRQR